MKPRYEGNLRFNTATKGRQQEQHLGRRDDDDEEDEDEDDPDLLPFECPAIWWAFVVDGSRAGRTLATTGRSNSFSRLDKCHHFIVEMKSEMT